MKKILLIFTFLCAVPSSIAFAYTYNAIDLGMIDLGFGERIGEQYPIDVHATAINNSGTVVGSLTQGLHTASFVYNETMDIIINQSFDGYSNPTGAMDINDAGIVVGFAENYGEMGAFIYNGSTIHKFDGFATAISNSGVVVGSAGYHYPYPFLYDGAMHSNIGNTLEDYPDGFKLTSSDGMMHDLRDVGINFVPSDVNDSGMFISGGNVYSQDGTKHELGSLTAYVLNNSGMVAGSSGGHAFLYDGSMKDLGTLGGDAAAKGINESGVVVGSSKNASGENRAFVHDGISMFDLNSRLNSDSLGITLSDAVDINDWGMIAANGMIDGLNRAFLLQPDWDATVTTSQVFITNYLTLGETFSFDYYWKMDTEPTQGNFDVLFFNGTEGETFGWTLNHGGSSVDWSSASFYVPTWARGDNVQIKFSLFDWGQETDPTVYLRNIASTSSPAPEPTTALLFGTGLVGLAALGRRRLK